MDKFTNSPNSELGISDTIGFLSTSLSLALSKECRLYVVIPIIINFIVLGLGGYGLFSLLQSFLQNYLDMLPEWLSFLSYVLWFILSATIGFVFFYIFSTIATIIASPFYGMLSEKAERLIRGVDALEGMDEGLAAIIKDVPRIIKRELQKMAFYLPRVLVCVVISIIPVVNIAAPICWFLLAAWMMSVQYVDYAYGNHKITFAEMRADLSQQRLSTFMMGAVISLAMAVPLLNLIIPPAAVCAGTKYYVEARRRFDITSSMRNPM